MLNWVKDQWGRGCSKQHIPNTPPSLLAIIGMELRLWQSVWVRSSSIINNERSSTLSGLIIPVARRRSVVQSHVQVEAREKTESS
jgi:hypothetical protein